MTTSMLKTSEQRVPKKRVALWDNAKLVVITLVVINHMLGTIRTQTETAFGIYTFSFFIHMPVIILIAGYFAKTEVTPKVVRATVQLAVVWVLWESIWAVIRHFGENEDLKSDFLISPAWTLWFLVSLVTMRIALPYIARLRRPLLFSFAIALAAGLSPAVGIDFSASRTLCFLPFFMLGWAARNRGWLRGEWFERPKAAARAAAATFMVGVATFFMFASPLDFWRLDTWLRWRDSYFVLFEDAPVGPISPEAWWSTAMTGMGIRAALILLQIAMLFAVLLLVSRRHSTLTVWGSRTLYVYLLHAPIVWVLRQTGFIDALAEWGPSGIITLCLIGGVLTVVLSTQWVAVATRILIEPKLHWFMKTKAPSTRHDAHGYAFESNASAAHRDTTLQGQR